MKRDERASFRVAYAAWLFGLFAFFLPGATWNPVSRLDLTRALVERGEIRIDRDVADTGDRAFAHGHWYTDKPPMVSFVAAPVYAAARAVQKLHGAEPHVETLGSTLHPAVRVTPNKAFQQALYACSLATSAVSGVAIGLLLFELMRRRTTSRIAFLSATFVVLGTPLFPYSTNFYSHVPAAALVLAAVYLLDPRGLHRPETVPSNAKIRAAGTCLALAPGCEYLTVAPAAAIGVCFLLIIPAAERGRVVRELALGAAGPVLALSAYHWVAFGAPWRTGYSFMTNPEFAAGHATGLLGIRLPSLEGAHGLLFGHLRGLFYIAPITVFGVMFGVQHARRRRDWASGVGLLVLAILFWLNAGYYMWWGGAAAGPRHLVPGLPFLAAGVMVGLSVRWAWVRWLTVALGCVSAANFLAITAVGVEAPEHGDILYEYGWRRLGLGDVAHHAGASNLGLKLGLSGYMSLVPLLVWYLAGFGYLLIRLGRSSASFRFRV